MKLVTVIRYVGTGAIIYHACFDTGIAAMLALALSLFVIFVCIEVLTHNVHRIQRMLYVDVSSPKDKAEFEKAMGGVIQPWSKDDLGTCARIDGTHCLPHVYDSSCVNWKVLA